MLWLLVCTLAVGFALFLLLSLATKAQNDVLRRSGVPVFRMSPVWYTFIKSILPQNQQINRYSAWLQSLLGTNHLFQKERILGIVDAGYVSVHLFKPEYIEAVLNSTTLMTKPWDYQILKPWLGSGLLLSKGEKWKQRRKLLTPAFHFKILERFMPVFNKHSFKFVENVKRRLEEQFLDVAPLMSLCTLDIIGETAMGVELKSQESQGSEYVKAIGKIDKITGHRLVHPFLWPDIIFSLSPSGREFKRALRILHNFTRKVISERKKELQEQLSSEKEEMDTTTDPENIYLKTKQRRAFLDLLLYHHLSNGSITEEGIREEVDTFMFEGHDTTAMGVSWALYNVGLYPDVQRKIHEELDIVFGDDLERAVTPDDLKELRYLECVLKESLRLYPSVPLIEREHVEGATICGMTLPKGSVLSINIINLHHDPELFPNPEIFDPERFFPENSVGRKNFAYVPFSAGPRNCIGQKFAMMEEKIILANIMRHFNVTSLDPPDKVIPWGSLVLRSLNGIRLKFTKRQADEMSTKTA